MGNLTSASRIAAALVVSALLAGATACDDRSYSASSATADECAEPPCRPDEDPDAICSDEVCNGLDDDCDGAVDEGLDVGARCDDLGGGGCTVLVRACAPDGTVECVRDAALADGSPCETLCSENGVCEAGECVGAQLVDCDDGDACTQDSCRTSTGCVHQTVVTPACCALEVVTAGGADLAGRGRIEDIEIRGDIAWLAAGRVGVHALDVSDPAAPRHLGWVDTKGDAFRLDVQGDMVYVGDRASPSAFEDETGLRVIDGSDPTNPRLLGSSAPQHLIVGVEVRGDYAYVPSFLGEFRVLDVSDPQAPTTVTSLPGDRDWDAWAIGVQGDRAYVLVSGGRGRVETYDIGDPRNPELIGQAAAFAYPHGMYVHKDRAYVSQYGRLQVFDIGEDTPRMISNQGGDFGRTPFVDDTNLYIAGSRGFRTYEATDRPRLLSRQPTPENTQAIQVAGGVAYVGIGAGAPLVNNPGSGGFATAEGGVWTYDVSDPASPSLLGRRSRRGQPEPFASATAAPTSPTSPQASESSTFPAMGRRPRRPIASRPTSSPAT